MIQFDAIPTSTVLALVLAVLDSACFALAALFQHRGVRRVIEPDRASAG